MSTLVQISTAVTDFLSHADRNWSETLTVSRDWAPDFDKKQQFRPTDDARLTIIPAGLITERDDSDDWSDSPAVGVMLQKRYDTQANGDTISDLVEEITTALKSIDLSAVNCELEKIEIAQWRDPDDLREKKVWTTGIVLHLLNLQHEVP